MDWKWAKARLKEAGKTHDDLAAVWHKSRTVVTRILSSDSAIKADQIRPLAALLDVPVAEVLFRAGFLNQKARDIVVTMEEGKQLKVEESPLQYVPLISWIEAEELSEVADPYEPGSAEEYIAMQYKRGSLIALTVRGQSMNREAPEGSTIIVDFEDRELMSGKLYVFKTEDGDASFKRYRDNPDRFEPVSTEEHETIFPTGNWFVVGRVVAVMQKK